MCLAVLTSLQILTVNQLSATRKTATYSVNLLQMAVDSLRFRLVRVRIRARVRVRFSVGHRVRARVR